MLWWKRVKPCGEAGRPANRTRRRDARPDPQRGTRRPRGRRLQRRVDTGRRRARRRTALARPLSLRRKARTAGSRAPVRERAADRAPAEALCEAGTACPYLQEDLRSGYVRILWELWAAGLTDEDLAQRWRDAVAAWRVLLERV